MKILLYNLGAWMIGKNFFPRTASVLIEYGADAMNKKLLRQTQDEFASWHEDHRFEPIPENAEFLKSIRSRTISIGRKRDLECERNAYFREYRKNNREMAEIDRIFEKMKKFLDRRIKGAIKGNIDGTRRKNRARKG